MRKIIINETDSGRRIDKFFSSFAKATADKKEEVFFNEDMTRGEIIRRVNNSEILVDGKKIKPSYILKEGDKIEISQIKKEKGMVSNKEIRFKILYQDKNLIVIDKPAGLQVHPDQRGNNDTLVNGLLLKFPEIKNVGDEPNMRPGIVHRLDKDTSGIMVVARNQDAFNELKSRFKNREIEKKYWAIVYGILNEKKGIIEKPLARSSNYKKQVVAGRKTKTKIRPAITEYRVLKGFENYSLIEASPKTGRTHQIRVHLASIGHPVVGDEKYRSKMIKKSSRAKRQLLHAKSLAFELFGKKYAFSSELPQDFNDFLENLTKET